MGLALKQDYINLPVCSSYLCFLEFIILDMMFYLAPLADFANVRGNFLSCLNITEDLMLCYCAKT